MLMETVIMDLLAKWTPGLPLSFAEPFCFTFMTYWFMRKLLPNRLNNCSITVLSLVYAVWFNLRTPDFIGTSYHLWMNIFINAFTQSIIIFLFCGKYWRKLLVWWYFDMVKMMCQTVSFAPVLLVHAISGFRGEWPDVVSSVESDVLLKLFYLAVFLSLFLLVGFLSVKIWRGVLMQKFQPFYLLFLLLPLGQKYSLALVINPNMGDGIFGLMANFVSETAAIYFLLSLMGIFISLIVDAAILYYVISQEKSAAIEAELRETQRVMELEQTRALEVAKRSDELAKIRHDLNNQLMSVAALVRLGEDKSAREMIDALMKEINS